MKTVIYVAMLAVLLGGLACYADLPPVKDRLKMPAILLSETPEEWVRLHRLSERSPQALLETLDKYLDALRRGETVSYAPYPDAWAYTREYVLNRLGDTAGPDVIPALEAFLHRWRTETNGRPPSGFNELSVRLTMERIQARSKGRQAYVEEMIRWLKGEYKPLHPSGPLSGTERTWRVTDAARALAVLQVREAAPLIVQKYREWSYGWSRLFLPHLARALAWLGEPSSLLEVMPVFLKEDRIDQPFLAGPLEPGQVDPAWAYWQVRTRGMSSERSIRAIVEAVAEGDSDYGVEQVLQYFGPGAVPVLIDLLNHPSQKPRAVIAQLVVIRALGLLRAQEAVPSLRRLLQTSESNSVRDQCAYALGKIGDLSALPDLVNAAWRDTDKGVRISALYALGEMRQPEAAEALLEVLRRHPDELARLRAADALGDCGQRWVVSWLVLQKMVEQSEEVRGAIDGAIYQLRKYGK